MAALLMLLFCLAGLYGLVHARAPRLAAAGRFIIHFHRKLALGLAGLGGIALLHFADAGAWMLLACGLLALGLWTLPLPGEAPAPTRREHLERASSWLAVPLLLALAGGAVLTWLEPEHVVPAAALEPEVVAATSPAETVFHSLGPRPEAITPPPSRAPQVAVEPVEEPALFWRLVEKVKPGARVQPAPAPAPSPAPPRKPAERRVAKAPAAEPVSAPAPTPAGVNKPVIDAMVARAEKLQQQGRQEEAAAVARNVLAFDPANAAARRIRDAAGSVAASR